MTKSKHPKPDELSPEAKQSAAETLGELMGEEEAEKAIETSLDGGPKPGETVVYGTLDATLDATDGPPGPADQLPGATDPGGEPLPPILQTDPPPGEGEATASDPGPAPGASASVEDDIAATLSDPDEEYRRASNCPDCGDEPCSAEHFSAITGEPREAFDGFIARLREKRAAAKARPTLDLAASYDAADRAVVEILHGRHRIEALEVLAGPHGLDRTEHLPGSVIRVPAKLARDLVKRGDARYVADPRSPS